MMKKVWRISLLFSGFLILNSFVINETMKGKEVNLIETSGVINVSAEALWKIIKNPNLSEWSTLIDSTRFSNSKQFDEANWDKRVSIVNSKGHHESHESLILYDEVQRKIRLASTKLPKFITSNETGWKVVDKGNGKSAIQIHNVMVFKPFMGLIFGKILKKGIITNREGIFDDLKTFAETGQVSSAKMLRIQVLKQQQNETPEY